MCVCVCVCVAAVEGRSELDELQEEVARRAREQEVQRRKEKEREAAMGFKIGRAHVCTPVTGKNLVWRLLREKKKHITELDV